MVMFFLAAPFCTVVFDAFDDTLVTLAVGIFDSKLLTPVATFETTDVTALAAFFKSEDDPDELDVSVVFFFVGICSAIPTGIFDMDPPAFWMVEEFNDHRAL